MGPKVTKFPLPLRISVACNKSEGGILWYPGPFQFTELTRKVTAAVRGTNRLRNSILEPTLLGCGCTSAPHSQVFSGRASTADSLTTEDPQGRGLGAALGVQ